MTDIISIERRDGPTGSYSEVRTSSYADMSWTDVAAGLVSGTTYYYRARRIIDDVPSEYSNETWVEYSTGPPMAIVLCHYRAMRE